MPHRTQNKYILQTENDRRVKQYHFTRRNVFSTLALGIVLAGATLFYSAEFFTNVIYKTKLTDIHKKYQSITTNIMDLQSKVDRLNNQIASIEEKDKAVRMYADLPEIDQDIRQVGVGGVKLEHQANIANIVPDAGKRLAALEMDVDELTRKVKLELASYDNIYDKMQENSDRLDYMPTVRPVMGGYLTSGFGYRKDPFDHSRRFHYGQDITVPTNSPLHATADGVVIDARYRGGFGKVVKINHGYGYTTLYAHMNKIAVNRGQKIKRGDLLGYTGNTGRSTAPHLHYEVHYYGTAQDPLDYFFSGYLK